MAEGSLHFEFVHFGEDFDLYSRALAPPALVLHRADCHVCVCSGFVSEQSGRMSSFLSQSKRVNLMTPTPHQCNRAPQFSIRNGDNDSTYTTGFVKIE